MELLPRVHLVERTIANAYIIVEDEGLTIIDTGMPGTAQRILSYVGSLGKTPRDVRRILLTHQHLDHVGGAAVLARETGAEVIASPVDAPAIEGTAPRELPHGPMRPIFSLVLLPRLRPVVVTRRVEAGEVVPVLAGEGGLRVVATPGHTRGQVAFYLAGRKLLFAGDAYQQQNGRIVAPPAIFTYDTAQAARSLVALTTLEIETSLCGHGAPILQGAGVRLGETAATLKV